jgi:hypothetical protein
MLGREKTFYDQYHFPWKGEGVPLDGVHQQAHIVFSSADLTEGFQCLGSFKKDQALTLAQFVLITYVAEALQKTIQYRGCHAGKIFVGTTPRVTIILNYLTTEVFSADEAHIPLKLDVLYNPSNIVGLMFSIFIMDPDLSFSDALSDMYVMNLKGDPYRKVKNGDNDGFAELVGAMAGAQAAQNGEAVAGQGADAPPVIGRPDIPGEFIDCRRSVYYFPKHNETHQKLLKIAAGQNKSQYKYLRLNSFDALINILSATSDNESEVVGIYSNNHLSSLGPAHSILLENLFTLDAALDKISFLGAHQIFQSKDNWVNNRRGNDGSLSFGAPCWGEGPIVHRARRDDVAQREYRAGQLDTAACIPMKYFTSQKLTNAWLPHCQITESSLLRADEALRGTRRKVNGREMCIDDMLESYDLLTGPRAMLKKETGSLRKDVFNTYFESMSSLETEIRKKMNASNPYEGNMLFAKLRRQGQHLHSLGNDIESPELPTAYKELISATWQQKHWIPQVEHLWQAKAVAMSTFAQIKIRKLVLFETFVKTSDSQLFLLPMLWRSAMTTYLPKINDHLNKEHIQMICSPGTSKSNLLNKLMRLLIKGTYEIQGGASQMGLVGEALSQRMIEIYHELNAMFAPAEDPKGPDASKTHMMLLTMMSEGQKTYKTTEKEITVAGDESRHHVTISSEETNVRIGARNFRDFHGTQGGTAEAMLDRWTQLTIRPVISDKRVNILVQVLQTTAAARSTASTRVEKQHKLLQRAMMEMCAGMAYYWLPLPDLSLFSDIAPAMVGWIARMKPQIFSALRQVAGLRTRQMAEDILISLEKVLFTPLNPTCKIVKLTEEEIAEERLQHPSRNGEPDSFPTERVEFGEYDHRILEEASKYTYSTMDSIVFVVTEKLFELYGAEGFEIVRGIAERGANYFTIGRGADDIANNFVYTPWLPLEGPSAPRIAAHLPWQSTPTLFTEVYLKHAQYYLGLPASSRQAAHQMRHQSMTKNADPMSGELGYNSYELLEENIPEEYKLLFETSAVRDKDPVKIERSERTSWKTELYHGRRYLNPNYVKVAGTIHGFARASNGKIGSYNLSSSAISDLLISLTTQTMTTPYMPLVLDPEGLVASEQNNNVQQGFAAHMNLIQSLRYIPGAMDRFPKYRVPPVISDTNANCFYLLVSYFETDAWKIATDMVEHVCYHSTRPRRTIMGIPSKSGSFLYEAIDIKPIRGKKLRILGKNNIRGASYSILRDYFHENNQPTTSADNISCDSVKEYYDEDIEYDYCKRYMESNWPTEEIDDLMEKYGPHADPFYGPEGFYTKYPKGLHTVAYPEVLTSKPVENIREELVDEPQTLVSPAFALEQMRRQNEKRRADTSFDQAMNTAAKKRANVGAPSQNNALLFDY